MKRWLAIGLSALMIFSLTACGGSQKNPDIISSSGVLELHNSSEPEEESSSSELPDSMDDPVLPGSSSTAPSSVPVINSSSAATSKPSVSSSSAASSKPPASSSSAASSKPSSSSSAPQSSSSSSKSSSSYKPNTNPSKTPSDEMRGVWISYLDFNTLLKNKSRAEFNKNINFAFAKIEAAGFNTVFVQVRPFGDALYESHYFPWSHTITGTEGEDPGFDPLALMIEAARDNDLRIEAWINPYRIRNSGTKAALSDNNLAQAWLEEGTGEVIEYDGGLYYNPGNEFARKLIVDGVTEILENYNVDGIHFDDYFYPTTDADFDADTYAQYKADGGKLSLANWRRENVNILVREVYAEIKRHDKYIEFGISPQGNNENNYNTQYIDVEEWVTNKGYVDYICPQIYFGFENENYPFAETVQEWDDMIRLNSVDLYIGMAPYKLGAQDSWAGSGKNEWLNTTNLLQRMVVEARRYDHYQGFAMFRYDSLFNPASNVKSQVETEKKNLKSILD